MRKRLLTDDQIAKIAAQIDSGKSIEQCCLNYKVSLITLRGSLRRNGFHEQARSHSPHHKRLTPELLARAEQIMAQGNTQSEAARAIGFTPQALNAKLRGRVRGPRDLPPKPKGRPSEFFSDERLKRHVEFNNAYLSTLQLRVSAQ